MRIILTIINCDNENCSQQKWGDVTFSNFRTVFPFYSVLILLIHLYKGESYEEICFYIY